MTLVYGITLDTLVLVICGANICEDRNIKGCQRLAATKQDMCQDNCMATLCPRTCGLCLQPSGNTNVFSAACTEMDSENCKDLLAKNIEGVCCHSNFCNGNYVPTTTHIPLTSTVDTTTASTQSQLGLPTGCTPSYKREHDECPSKFIRKGNSCYFVGQHARIRHDAMMPIETRQVSAAPGTGRAQVTSYGDKRTLIGDLDHMTKPNLMANIALVLERLNPGTLITDITGTEEAVRFMRLQSANIL
ncbi:Hypothetical predicted protein [Mytilus galloprovincialis]|uniref:ShKT domain-containing protein n=1 Tax=Mytilus galloprovincialis TaxID=29158 RepID=A0A8B6EH84_MYTGA|nr:Hypothetical predicted protein [Mytilus galloprovincialis]